MGNTEEWVYRTCRFCRSSSVRAHYGPAHKPKTYGRAGAEPHYAPDLVVRMLHTALDIAVEPEKRTLSGIARLDLEVLAPKLERLKLDQGGLKIESVLVSGKTAKWDAYAEELWVDAGELPHGTRFSVEIKYAIGTPRRGIYFTGPTAAEPKRGYQVWTQGQDEDNHYWFPTLDYPNQKATFEVRARVPKGYVAVSNGKLVSKSETEFAYKIEQPIVTYLVTLTVGKFETWSDLGPRGLPVEYYVAQGRKADGVRAFSQTPKMIEAFERKIGVPYPYPKYAQVAVQDFIFGGMENASATTQTDQTLHDERAHLDFSSDPLVSHELAHQWFGDLLTCRDWSHGWLNEGFATFMERVWIENDTGTGGGIDEARYYSLADWREYRDDDQGRYRRPIVCNRYKDPQDLFDTHLYQKGGLVLNLLRGQLGDDLFWKSIQRYVSDHQNQNVETLDLIRAIEKTTGRNLRRFFDAWVFGEGYPEFEASLLWDADKKRCELSVEQKQEHVFHLSLNVEFYFEGRTEKRTMDLTESKTKLVLETPDRPKWVRLDPGGTIPKTLKFKRPREMILSQLRLDADCLGRIEAAHDLVEEADLSTIADLCKAFESEKFWGVQAEIAEVLAKTRQGAALVGLQKLLGLTKNPKARRAVVKAIGSFRSLEAAQAVEPHVQSDPSYFVEAEAILAYGKCASVLGDEDILKKLEPKLVSDSYRDVIRRAVFGAFAEMQSVGVGDSPAAKQVLSLMETWSQPTVSRNARVGVILAMGQILAGAGYAVRDRLLKRLSILADEDDFGIRGSVLAALETAEVPAGIPIATKIHRVDSNARVHASAESVQAALGQAGSTPEQLTKLREEFEKLQAETRALREKVEQPK